MCCVVFYLAYTFPNRKVKSGVGELREGSLRLYLYATIVLYTVGGFHNQENEIFELVAMATGHRLELMSYRSNS